MSQLKKPVKQAKLSDVILAELEAMIIEGSLKAGEKLPAERELAKQFEVSRPSLREAIQKLEAKGLVVRKQGGGTFVKDTILTGLSDPLFELMAHHGESQFDLLEFRHGVEGMSAYYAAMRGTAADYQEIQVKHDAIGTAQLEQDVQKEAEAILGFHLAICAASHNAVILQVARSIAPLLVENIAKNLAMLSKHPEVFSRMTDYRERLLNAILSKEPQKAWGASHRHLTFIEEALLKSNEEKSRLERSIRRIQRKSF
ncbi:pyruvate dehydrogenase complex transcriptional repressor PdhR [Thalassotalea agarivorans]|uniref:Pyruvate dehydrogenase complex repressor n=1 Tax=Thalassotalea agarivorans TaxID=349064 RepID=A0A1I0AVQ8_THASX|nr:pyruvate dehydrogenase complex transcriptional repressor PdhR [Thalassotalea agarivorans]SES98469.1 transcriptional regulator, GntR family [Thalassotalea agarivorans]